MTTSGTRGSARWAALLARPQVQRVLLVALVLLYTGWIGYQWVRDYLIDFNVYYLAAYGFTHGFDVYGMGGDYRGADRPAWEALAAAADVEVWTAPYRYPPLTAQLVLPLLGFSEQVAGMIWLVLTAAAFVAAAWWLGRLWRQPEGPGIVYLLTLGFVPTLTTLHAGQVNGFVLLALVAGLAGLAYRNQVLAGVALAVATLLKLVPLALCLYLGWRRQWVAAAACAVALGVLLLTAPITLAPDVLARYAENFFAVSERTLHATAANQGISGFWARGLQGWASAETIYLCYVVSVLVVLVGTLVLCWPPRGLPAFWPLEYSLILCTLMLIPPYTWYHMLVLLLIPLVVVVEYLWRGAQWALLGVVIAAYLVNSLHGLIYHAYAHTRWFSSIPFGFVVLLWGLLAWMIVRERRAAAAPAVSTHAAFSRP